MGFVLWTDASSGREHYRALFGWEWDSCVHVYGRFHIKHLPSHHYPALLSQLDPMKHHWMTLVKDFSSNPLLFPNYYFFLQLYNLVLESVIERFLSIKHGLIVFLEIQWESSSASCPFLKIFSRFRCLLNKRNNIANSYYPSPPIWKKLTKVDKM